jgi:hypothetical protein
MTSRRPALLALLLLPIAVAACKGAPDTHLSPAIVKQVSLRQAESCGALQQTVADNAVRQMRAELDQEKNWDSNVYGPTPVAAGGADNGTPTGASAPASYSTTNTQVQGVDESDFMKNDGTRIFSLSGDTLYASTSWPPQNLSLAGQLKIEGWPNDMFLDGNRVVVFSSVWTVPTGGGLGYGGGYGFGGGPVGGARLCDLAGDGCFYGWSTTKITVVDVTNLAAPQVTAQLYLPGSSNGARRVGSSVRLVLSDSVRWPEAVQWWPNDGSGYGSGDHDKWVAAIDALEDKDEAIIRAQPLKSWFPDGQRLLPDGTAIDLTYDCTDFYVSNAPEQLGLVTLATLDLDNLAAGVSRASIIGQAGIIYATAEHLYLASEHWWWWPGNGEQDWTYIHEFDISDPAKSTYIASGGVDGHLRDQFSLDEHDGYLRVASSTATYSQDAGSVDGYLVGSRLSVLAPQKAGAGQALTLVGEIPSLEENEQLTAMRFVGNKGYAVTFRAIDPLVTLDLSDPKNPKKVAELTVPGFSTYLQPIDANHLLAIGEDFPVNSSGVPDYEHRSMQISLFDVSDLKKPTRTANIDVGTAWSYSEALWDHHAFNWYQPDPTKPGILAIPFSDWSNTANNTGDYWNDFVSDVRLFSVDAAAGTIGGLGSLSMSDIYIQNNDYGWSWYYRPWVRRSVLSTATDGTVYAYAVSDAGLRVAKVSQLNSPLATSLYPAAITNQPGRVAHR